MMNINKQKVSVIIPYYNSMEFVEICLNSVLAQSYSDIEIIIINDGSDEENSNFLESLLTDDRIVYIKNDRKRGVAFSRNIGIEKAAGEYIFFLDSDDLLTSDALEVLVENIQDSPAIFGTLKRLVRSSDINVPNDIEESSDSSEPIESEELLKWIDEPKVIRKELSPRKLFKGGSILNGLIKSEFIRKNHIRFYEGTEGYTDISGIIPFIIHVEKLPKLTIRTYYKRAGIHPITNPALIQRPIEERVREFIKLYLDLNKEYGQIETAKRFLDRIFLSYYRRTVIYIFKDSNNFDEFFKLYGKAIKLLDKSRLSSQPMHIRGEIKHLERGNQKKFQKFLRLHIEARDFRNGIRGVKRFKKYLYKKAFQYISNFPVKNNLIMFESFLGKQYSDNPRAIYQYLKDHHPEYKMYWSVDPRFKKGLPQTGVPYVNRFSIKWLFLTARARFWVTNSRMPLWIPKPKNTIYLQTWHGTPLKKLAQDQKEVLMPGTTTEKYKKNFHKESRNWDYLVSPNRYSTEIFRSAFQFDKQMIESGYPRNDVFYSTVRDERASAFKKNHGLPEDKKFILYAPTWRDNQYHQVGQYKMDLKLDLEKLRNELGEEYIVILRMHYLVAENFDLDAYQGFAYDFSKHEDIQDLYLISDLLITDYSSVFFDYANLKRPMIFFTYDIDEYRGDIRGFYFNFEEEAPGPIVKTTEEVIEAIKNMSRDQDSNKRFNDFYQRFCYLEDGHAAERVVKEVILKDKNM